MDDRLGFRRISHNDMLWIVNNKKHPEYEAQQAAWNAAKEALTVLTPEGKPEEAKEKIKPAIAYFNELKTKYTGSEKADKKLRYSAFYGLAKIYLMLDMPDGAIKEADKLVANDYDEKDGRYLKEQALELKAILERNHVSSRHFEIDTSKFKGPEQ